MPEIITVFILENRNEQKIQQTIAWYDEDDDDDGGVVDQLLAFIFYVVLTEICHANDHYFIRVTFERISMCLYSAQENINENSGKWNENGISNHMPN